MPLATLIEKSFCQRLRIALVKRLDSLGHAERDIPIGIITNQISEELDQLVGGSFRHVSTPFAIISPFFWIIPHNWLEAVEQFLRAIDHP